MTTPKTPTVVGAVDLRPGVRRHRRVRPPGPHADDLPQHSDRRRARTRASRRPGQQPGRPRRAVAADCRLCLIDGKQVELGQWEQVADVFVGPDVARAITTLRRLQAVMDNRYTFLRNKGRRKIARGDEIAPILVAIDEIAYFSATVGDRKTQETFSATLRDLVARGRAVGIMVVAATQRPSSDIIPTSSAGSVRVAVRRPVHHRRLLRHRARPRLGVSGLVGERDRPEQPGRRSADRRGWDAAAGEDGVSVR